MTKSTSKIASELGKESARVRRKMLGKKKFKKSMQDLAILRWMKQKKKEDLHNRKLVS